MIYNHRDKITKYLTDQVFHEIYGSGPKTYTHYITNLHIMCNMDSFLWVHIDSFFGFYMASFFWVIYGLLDLYGLFLLGSIWPLSFGLYMGSFGFIWALSFGFYVGSFLGSMWALSFGFYILLLNAAFT